MATLAKVICMACDWFGYTRRTLGLRHKCPKCGGQLVVEAK